jgi:hypothetical protein
MEPFVLESCNSTWVFDPCRMRFRRALKGIEVDGQAVWTQWRRYYGLDLPRGSEAFTVMLNPSGTRLLRSWRHTEACAQCGERATRELSLREIESIRSEPAWSQLSSL